MSVTTTRPVEATSAAVLGRLTRSVCVVSVCQGDAVHAMTVDSLTVACAEPALVTLAVRQQSRWWQLASASGQFAVSVLAQEQQALARHFASRSRGADRVQFHGLPIVRGPVTGAPVLGGAAAWFEVRTVGETHVDLQVVVVAAVVGAPDSDLTRAPLLRRDGRYLQ